MKIRIGSEWFPADQWFSLDPHKKLTAPIQYSVDFISDWLKGERLFTFTTSGSTGTPKSISFTREQLISSASLTQQALGLRKGDVALVCLDTRFIAGAMMLVRGLVTEMDLVLAEPARNPFQEYRDTCDFVALVPMQALQTLVETPEHLKEVRNIIIGGGPVDESLRQKLQSCKGSVYATYGMTETITHVALQKLNGPNPQDCFEALPGIAFEKDDRGCLVINAPHLPESVVTNDMVSLIDPKHFRWSGRIDNVINSGGIKIQKESVEQAIASIFETLGIPQRFFVDGIPDTSLGNKIVLVIEGQPLGTSEENKVLEEIRRATDRFHVPKVIFYVDHFLETATQKVDRRLTMKQISR